MATMNLRGNPRGVSESSPRKGLQVKPPEALPDLFFTEYSGETLGDPVAEELMANFKKSDNFDSQVKNLRSVSGYSANYR